DGKRNEGDGGGKRNGMGQKGPLEIRDPPREDHGKRGDRDDEEEDRGGGARDVAIAAGRVGRGWGIGSGDGSRSGTGGGKGSALRRRGVAGPTYREESPAERSEDALHRIEAQCAHGRRKPGPGRD